MSESHYFNDKGGALLPDHPTYIERQADNELFDALKREELCYVLNARQMGKSSLAAKIMNRLQAEGSICAFIDLGNLNTDNEIQWYSSFISELNYYFQLLEEREERAWLESNKHRPSNLILKRFFEDILFKTVQEGRIVIFLDEIDVLISRRFKEEFLGFIRSCYNQRANNHEYNRVIFCLLGVVAPSDLLQNKRQTFNLGKDIELTGLDYHKAEKSFSGGLAEKVNNPEEMIQQIFKWTNGQPFLTQKLCQLVVENAVNHTINIDVLVKQYFILSWESKSDGIKDHLQNISNCILRRDRDPVYLLLILGQVLDGKAIRYNPQNPEHIQLKLSGLIKNEPYQKY